MYVYCLILLRSLCGQQLKIIVALIEYSLSISNILDHQKDTINNKNHITSHPIGLKFLFYFAETDNFQFAWCCLQGQWRLSPVWALVVMSLTYSRS